LLYYKIYRNLILGQQVSEKIKYTLLCGGFASVLTEWNETICCGALCMIVAFAKIAKFAILQSWRNHTLACNG
jgi:hypothetical protein